MIIELIELGSTHRLKQSLLPIRTRTIQNYALRWVEQKPFEIKSPQKVRKFGNVARKLKNFGANRQVRHLTQMSVDLLQVFWCAIRVFHVMHVNKMGPFLENNQIGKQFRIWRFNAYFETKTNSSIYFSNTSSSKYYLTECVPGL